MITATQKSVSVGQRHLRGTLNCSTVSDFEELISAPLRAGRTRRATFLLLLALGSCTITPSQAQGSILCDIGSHDVTSAATSLFCRPPPKLPDLIAAFSDSLRQSVALLNVSRRLFDTVSSCRAPCRAGRCLDAYDCSGTSADAPCRRTSSSIGATGRHQLQANVPPPPQSTTRRTTPQADHESSIRKQPFYSNREDTATDDSNWWWTADKPRSASHPDNRLHQSIEIHPAPALGSQSTASTSSRQYQNGGGYDNDDVSSSFIDLWTTLHGKLLVIAVSISLVAAVIVLTVWIALRSRLLQNKYGEANSTEEAVSMYSRVVQEADQQRRLRVAAASTSGLPTGSETLNMRQTSQRYRDPKPLPPPTTMSSQPNCAAFPIGIKTTNSDFISDVMAPPGGIGGAVTYHPYNRYNHHHQLVLSHDPFSDERTIISSQPVRRYL